MKLLTKTSSRSVREAPDQRLDEYKRKYRCTDEVMSGLSCRACLYRDEARRGVSVAAAP